MKWLLWGLLIALGLLVGGWMTFDALRRLVVGDYVRIDGQLGPWQHLFRLCRIDPMGIPVALLFLTCGVAHLAGVVGLLLRAPWGWELTVLASIATLWFVPVGTAASVTSLVLLFLGPVRSLFPA